MELIPYNQFAKLRLKQFVEAEVDLDEMEGIEWMGGVWIDEYAGLSAFRRLEATPNEMGGLVLDFSEISQNAASAILEAVKLPLKPGMTFDEVRSVLGAPEKINPVKDLNNCDFTIGSQQPFFVSCTLHHSKGLTGLIVIRKDVLLRIEEAEENDR